MEFYDSQSGRRDRAEAIDRIVSFVRDHPHSYASLAICRRALDSGIETVDKQVVAALQSHLADAPESEIDAYYSIVM